MDTDLKMTIGEYLLNLLKLLDVAGNVIIIGFIKFFIAMPPACGNSHFTMSEALDELRNEGSVPACQFCKLLSWVFQWFQPLDQRKGYDHCAQSMIGMPEDVENS